MNDHPEPKKKETPAERIRRLEEAGHRIDADPRSLRNKTPEELAELQRLSEQREADEIKFQREFKGLRLPKGGDRGR